MQNLNHYEKYKESISFFYFFIMFNISLELFLYILQELYIQQLITLILDLSLRISFLIYE